MVGNWKAWNLDAFDDKQQWNIWGNPVLGSNISAKKYVSLCDSNLLYRIMSSVMLCYPDTSGTLYHSTWHNTSENLNLCHIHHEDTKSHKLWLLVTKLHKVKITAVAVQVVTAFSRQGQFCDCDSIILLHCGLTFCTLIAWPVILLQAIMTYRCFLWDVSHVGATGTAEDCFSDETFHFDKHIA